ncbi:MAG: DinB family protein [Bacteroidota bacterium]
MNKQEIQNKLRDNHQAFIDLILSLNDEDFLHAADGKWTAGQQLDHICRSAGAVSLALLLPKFALKMIIGKANRPSKNYEELVTKYKLKLEGGGRAGGHFVPGNSGLGQKKKLKDKLVKIVNALCKRTEKYNEQQLDDYILPHPLLGKLTLREMLYFTIYHAEHHRQLVLKNLKR